MSDLNDKQIAFTRFYINDFNATKAAKRAGYSEKTCESQGSTLLRNPKVQAEIRRLIEEKEGSYEIERKGVLNELAKIAFSDISNLCSWSNDGIDYIDSKKLMKKHTASIKKITCKKVDSEKSTTTTVSLELYDKSKALELIGKHLGIFGILEEDVQKEIFLAFDRKKLAEEAKNV
jgi:phage terminase small subunit